MTTLVPLTLSFRDGELERAYADSTYPRIRRQGQTAMLIGMFVYLLCGVLDQWFVPLDIRTDVWTTRLTALCVPTVVLALTFSPVFRNLSQLLLAAVCVAAGIGLISIQMPLPIGSAPYYYPAMVLVTFFSYNFIGIRFIYALVVDLFLLTTYNLVFGGLLDYPLHILLGHDTYIVSANLIGGAAGYLAERQKRILYVREKELDQERQLHLTRSLHDRLTGLPNRELLYDRIGRAMATSRRSEARHCGFFIDLDGFKAINDGLGHSVGDDVLKHVAQRLLSVVREVDTVARIGGDEFFVLALDMDTEEATRKLAQKISEQVKKPIPGISDDFSLSASIGICRFPYEGMDIVDIVRQADVAMYDIKSTTKDGYSFASPCVDA